MGWSMSYNPLTPSYCSCQKGAGKRKYMSASQSFSRQKAEEMQNVKIYLLLGNGTMDRANDLSNGRMLQFITILTLRNSWRQ